MIPIYLCEDDKNQLDLLASTIEKYIFIQGYDMEIVCRAASPHDLLSALAPKAETAVYFLDIQLGSDMDGIELAAKIRKNDPRAFIIFTTTHSEMAMTTFRYQVEPLDFLVKDDPQYTFQILHCLKNIIEKSSVPAPDIRLHLHLPDQDLFLPVSEILYIQSTAAHRITIHTVNGIYQCGGSLNETMSRLDDSFFLCHKSALVNTRHIRSIFRRPCYIELDGGATCPCAQRRFKQLQKLMETP
ncbi:MAG: LytR/AlgR family response regulator transcription factor [Eisenbergiella sp.]